MNKIGFHNFRRFENFYPIDYKDITFLVGRNNSGKSTFVKALLLLNDYLKSNSVGTFSFGKKNVEDVNIVTFGRAKNAAVKDDIISFKFQQDDFEIDLIITGQKEDTTCRVMEFRITDHAQNFRYIIEPEYSQITFESLDNTELNIVGANSALTDLIKQQKIIKKQLNEIKEKNLSDYISLNYQLTSLKSKIKEYKKVLKKESFNKTEFSIAHLYYTDSISDIFLDTIGDAIFRYKRDYNEIQKGSKPDDFFADYKEFYNNVNAIQRSIKNFQTQIKQSKICYLGATLCKQSALFAIRDKSNALAQAIHDFKQLNINRGETAYRFIQKWMGREYFDIGTGFKINMYAGESYEFLIKFNKSWIPLADKGTGSIQAMLLVLRLATIIHKKEKGKSNFSIFIEEPELNLHPALQSKLADLFLEVNQDYKIKFLIETHSEYLIRKTQLLVKQKEFEIKPNENPFSVLYFDNDKQYKMNYREDGKFIEEFGTGFFDESRKIVKQLI